MSQAYEAPSRSRIRALDRLRGVAIIAVVASHVVWAYLREAPLGSDASAIAGFFYLAVVALGGAAFIATSAAGLALRKSSGGFELTAYLRDLRRRARRILPGYVFWSLLSAWLWQPGRVSSPSRIVSLLLHGHADAHFYFVPLLFELYVFWPLLEPLARAARTSMVGVVAVTVLGIGVSALWWTGTFGSVLPSGTIALLPMHFAYVAAGIGMAPYLQNASNRQMPRSAMLLAPAALATAWAISFFGFLGATRLHAGVQSEWVLRIAVMPFQPSQTMLGLVATVTCLILSFATPERRWARIFDLIGLRSYGVFLTHFVVMRLLAVPILGEPAVALRTSVLWPLHMLCMLLVVTALSYTLVAVLWRVPFLATIVGQDASDDASRSPRHLTRS